MHKQTEAVHAGVDIDSAYNSVSTPIYATSTFRWDKLGKHRGYDYGRSANPTRTALEVNLAKLEGGASAAAVATGMAAVSVAAFLLKSGKHMIAPRDIYGGTHRLFSQVLPNYGVRVSFIDMCDPAAVEAAVSRDTAALWIETPSNPLLRLTDIEAMVAIARKHDLLTIADNTFMSPWFQRPLDLGVDVVIHSTTKYINGHSDIVGGAVISRTPELGQRVAYLVNAMGTCCSPFDAFLTLRGVKTLAVRMEAHQHNARAVANFLAEHPNVRRVYYPEAKDYPQKELARRQMSGPGAMLSFDLNTDRVEPDRFFERLNIFALAESLGGVESLIEQPWSMSHSSMDEESRRQAGLSPGTIRVSVGIEHPDDLIADLRGALEK